MQRCLRTALAEEDLISIWNYTADTWGERQADNYLNQLEARCGRIAAGEICGKALPDIHARLLVARCKHHYLFFLAAKPPVILAVLHEKMDCLARLKKRLV